MANNKPPITIWSGGEYKRWCDTGRHYFTRDAEGWSDFGNICPEHVARNRDAAAAWNTFLGR